MSATETKTPASTLAGFTVPLGSVVFVVACCLYVRLRIDPALLYHCSWVTASHPVAFPNFFTGLAFLKPFLSYPGGPVRYAAAFLCQLYYFPWLGAGVIAALAWALAATVTPIITAVAGKRPRVLQFAPALVLLVLFTRYRNPMDAGLAMLAATAGVSVYLRVGVRRRRVGLPAFAVLGLAVYWLAGGAFLLYCMLCAVCETWGRQRWRAGLVCVAYAAALPFVVGATALSLRLTDAYGQILPFHLRSDPDASLLLLCLYLSAPAAVLLAGLIELTRPWSGRASLIGRVLVPTRLRDGRLAAAMPAAFAVIVAALVLTLSTDDDRRTLFLIERYSQQLRWDDLLKTADRLPLKGYTLPAVWDVNRALYHTGQLTSAMFAYPQDPVTLVQPPLGLPSHFGCIKLSDVLLDMGRINESEHVAYEALEFLGDDPRILRRLARIRATKGETAAARVLLGFLSRDLIYGGWARDALRQPDDRLLTDDPVVQRLRTLMVQEDPRGDLTTELMLRAMLKEHPENRMAFEYLMGYYMITGQLGRLAADVRHYAKLGYPSIPPLCEEALLIHAASTGTRANLGGLELSAQSQERFRRFYQVLATYRGDRRAARQALRRSHGRTYFYYHMYLRPREGEA